MKKESTNSHRGRIAAAICAVIVLAGETAGIKMLHAYSDDTPAAEEKTEVKKAAADNSNVISAGGTISSSQISDELGLKDTSARLTVEEVLVEAGDTVTEGTPLYKVTSDSLTKAEKTLRSELNYAENSLRDQKSSYQIEKTKAEALYESELLLGDTAQTDYDSSVKSLDSDLQKALDDYVEALDTVSDTPSEITEKQSELDEKQAAADELTEEKASIQEKVNAAKKEYSSAADSLNGTLPDYNAAAGAAKYLGNMLGKDVSNIVLKESGVESPQEKNEPVSENDAGRGGSASEKPDDMPQGDFDLSSIPEGGTVGNGAGDFGDFSAPTGSGSETRKETQEMPENTPSSDAAAKPQGSSDKKTGNDTSKKSGTASAAQITFSTASEISKKQEDLKALQTESETLEAEKSTAQKQLDSAKTDYTSALNSYNKLVAEYNAAAGTVRYLGAAIGKDVSDIALKQTVSGIQEQSGTSDSKSGGSSESKPDSFSGSGQMPDLGSFGTDGMSFNGTMGEKKLAAEAPSEEPTEETDKEQTEQSEQVEEKQEPDALTALYNTVYDEYKTMKEKLSRSETQLSSAESEYKSKTEALTKCSTELEDAKSKMTVLEAEISVLTSSLSDIEGGYKTALAEYSTQKEKLDSAEKAYKTAKEEYEAQSDTFTECSSELKELQSDISALNKDISSLENTLSKAKSNLSKLKSQYDSLKSSYQKDKLELQHTLDSDNASYENAKYHYDITLSTIDAELEKAQEAYDTAAENMRIFEEALSGGYICAGRDGIISSLSFREGRNADPSSPFAYYVDERDYYTTVELDQYDVTQITIGDTVVIYSSETGISNGRVTAVSAGESTSLADVNFNVQIAADEGSNLYSGESVNVYFNYDDMKTSELTDFRGGEGEKSGFDGERPDFSGGMPDGFDPSNMPGFNRRKEE